MPDSCPARCARHREVERSWEMLGRWGVRRGWGQGGLAVPVGRVSSPFGGKFSIAVDQPMWGNSGSRDCPDRFAHGQSSGPRD